MSLRAYFAKLERTAPSETQGEGRNKGGASLRDEMPQVWKSRPPSGRKRRKSAPASAEPTIPLVKPVVQESKLWVEKHTPNTLADLVVHSKKVGDVRAWLESRLHPSAEPQSGSRVLILTGPPGVGKSAVIRVLGKTLGLEFFEWTTPTPTPWQEHVHQGSSGSRYMSKLDEFEMFLENARKFPLLPVQSRLNSGKSSAAGRRVKVLLLEDLPLVNDSDRMQQLCRLLHTLVLSACFITVVVMTDVAEDAGGRHARSGGHREILHTLEGAGATKIVFKPVTANAIKKLLMRIAVLEKCRVSGDSISAIAESCGGDLRHAISSLEFLTLGNYRTWSTGRSLSYEDTKIIEVDDDVNKLEDVSPVNTNIERGTSSCSTSGRDNVLSQFHALGKFLHNKRHTDQTAEATQGSLLVLNDNHRRFPLNMEVPERILAEAQIEFSGLVAFLHENVLQFVDEDAMDDVVDILGYLSDADTLLGKWPKQSFSSLFSTDSNDVNPSQIAALAAGSVAARGVLFANAHPAPCKWQSLRGPTLWQVERRLAEKKDSVSRFQSTCNAVGARAPAQTSQTVPPQSSQDFPPPEAEDESVDDIESLRASCIIDLDSLEDLNDDFFPSSTPAKQMVHIDRGSHCAPNANPIDSVEDDDIIEDD